MKILHLWFPNIFEFKGGIQVYLQDLLAAIIKYFPELQIIIYNKLDKGETTKNFSQNVSFYFYGNTPSFLRTVYFATSLFIGAIKERPNLIVCAHLNFAPVAYWVHMLTGIPYWILVYGTDAWEVKSKIKHEALKAATQIVSISGYTRDRLLQEHNLEPSKISLLPVTFDASRFEIAPKPKYLLEKYNLDPDQPVILTVTRLSRSDGYKGYDQVIQALLHIKEKIPNIHYLIVGKGDDRPRIEQLVANLNLQAHVTLTGFIPDQELQDHYNLCDIFAMPSKGEGFGIVYLEALACGKPTLGGNQDGAIDALCHGEIGALVDPDNVQQIAQTLIQILHKSYPNPVIYQPQVLRQRVIEVFGVEQFQKTLAELIKSSPLEVSL